MTDRMDELHACKAEIARLTASYSAIESAVLKHELSSFCVHLDPDVWNFITTIKWLGNGIRYTHRSYVLPDNYDKVYAGDKITFSDEVKEVTIDFILEPIPSIQGSKRLTIIQTVDGKYIFADKKYMTLYSSLEHESKIELLGHSPYMAEMLAINMLSNINIDPVRAHEFFVKWRAAL
jgi:hypothetical protein